MENFNDSNSSACFYCQEYHAIYSDVPLNEVIYDTNGITPRCYLHYKYQCSSCEISTHFNGLSWCHECKIYTCIDCGNEIIKKINFLIYEYYFEISCNKCGLGNPALDYAEYTGKHPYQIGDLWPKQPINIWLPMNSDENIETLHNKLSGTLRIQKLSNWNINAFEEPTNNDLLIKLGKDWTKFLGRNHRILLTNLVLPEMLKIIDAKPQEMILEIGCAEGELSRIIAETDAKVTGIDTSTMITNAIDSKKYDDLDITYLETSLEDFNENYDTLKFDKIVCNLKIMTIKNLSSLFEIVFHHLKTGGEFIFSISHPFFGIPNGLPIRIPPDSHRNEDSFWMIDNYFEEGIVRMLENGIPHESQLFRRTLSTYLNKMISMGFALIEISEPQANQELVKNFPNQMFNDNDRTPAIMIIRARKL